MAIPDDDGQYPSILTQLALAHRPPGEFLTQIVFTLPTLGCMGSLFYPCYQAGKRGEPQYGVDDINDSVNVGIGKAAYPLENRRSCLVDESRYGAPALKSGVFISTSSWVR